MAGQHIAKLLQRLAFQIFSGAFVPADNAKNR